MALIWAFKQSSLDSQRTDLRVLNKRFLSLLGEKIHSFPFCAVFQSSYGGAKKTSKKKNKNISRFHIPGNNEVFFYYHPRNTATNHQCKRPAERIPVMNSNDTMMIIIVSFFYKRIWNMVHRVSVLMECMMHEASKVWFARQIIYSNH